MARVVISEKIKGWVPEDRRDRYDAVYSGEDAQFVMDAILKYIKKRIETSIENCESEGSYTLPAWSEKQADGNGYRRALRELQGLLPLVKPDATKVSSAAVPVVEEISEVTEVSTQTPNREGETPNDI